MLLVTSVVSLGLRLFFLFVKCLGFAKQCLIEETLTKPCLFLVALVVFLNSMNLDTKVVVAILGQDSPSLVVVSFFDFHPLWLLPALFDL